MPNFELSFVVTTDASLVSIGAILEQDFGQGLQPVAYESRKLNPAEMQYLAYERELLGIVWAIGKWRHYLEGRLWDSTRKSWIYYSEWLALEQMDASLVYSLKLELGHLI